MSLAAPPPPAAKPGAATQPAVDNFRGALLLIAAMVVFTIEAVTVRWLGQRVSATQVVMFRSFGQIIVVFGWAFWLGAWPSLRSRHYGLHVARGLISLVSWWLYYYTFQKLDLALATLLTFASSLFVVVLAGPVLGEKVKLVSWIATLTGFAGVMIASGIGVEALRVEIWLGLASAALSAAIVFLTRALAQTDDTVTIMAWIGIFVVVGTLPVAWLTWQPLDPAAAAILLASGILGALGMVLMIEAYGVGEASVLAPIPYVRIAFSMVVGMLLLSEMPQRHMLIGTCVVIISALYAMRAERKARQRR